MQCLLLLPLLVLGARAEPCYTQVYSGMGQTGTSVYFGTTGASPNLSTYGMDDDIESVRQTGMWLYFENEWYNMDELGSAYYVHGIDIAVTFPAVYQNIMTSLRSAGCREALNEDMFLYYEYTVFAGLYNRATTDDNVSTGLVDDVSSILLTGSSPWTVYTGKNYTGSSWCLYSTDHDVGSDGSTLDLGIFPFVEDIGIPDNSILSFRKGCFTDRVAEAPKLQVEGRQENGAWGRLV